MLRANGADFGDGHLEFRQDFQEERLELFIRAVYLVDEQDGRLVVLGERGQQRALQQKFAAEDVFFAPRRRLSVAFAEPNPQQLFGVIPLVQRGGHVQPFVTLQPDEARIQQPRHDAGYLRLAHPGAPLDEQRTLQRPRHVDGRGDGRVGDIVPSVQLADYFSYGVVRIGHVPDSQSPSPAFRRSRTFGQSPSRPARAPLDDFRAQPPAPLAWASMKASSLVSRRLTCSMLVAMYSASSHPS